MKEQQNNWDEPARRNGQPFVNNPQKLIEKYITHRNMKKIIGKQMKITEAYRTSQNIYVYAVCIYVRYVYNKYSKSIQTYRKNRLVYQRLENK